MSGGPVARSIRLARRQIGKPIGARRRARNSARNVGCIEHRRLGSGDNGTGSKGTSDCFDEGDDGHDCKESKQAKRAVEFRGDA